VYEKGETMSKQQKPVQIFSCVNKLCAAYGVECRESRDVREGTPCKTCGEPLHWFRTEKENGA
jgi:hypothetical protein